MIGVAVVALAVASGAMAQITGTYPATPLVSKHYASPTDLPYKVDTDTQLIRGPQLGYNICNSTTENQKSLCQTFYFNDASDFCLTYPAEHGEVASLEGEMVAWCSKPGHGTRLIPDGAVQGIEYRKMPGYQQIVGYIDQTQVLISADDYGGEMDSGGADGRGNPMGGVYFSTGFQGGKLIQTPNWTCFVGGGMFGLKVCDPSDPNAAHNCEHIYDRIGIAYNMPNNAQKGTYVECDADGAAFPGVYTTNGQVVTYTQPDEALGAISTMPYQPVVPSASNCKTYTSAQLFTSLPAGSGSASASGSGSKTSGVTTAKSTGTAKPSGSGSAAGSSQTGSGAEALVVSAASSLFGVVFAALFLA